MVSSLVTSRQRKQIKGLKLISGVKFALGSSLTLATNMKFIKISKISHQVKEAEKAEAEKN